MDYYEVELPEAPGASLTLPTKAGDWSFTIEFRWPSEIQEMWDEFQAVVSKLGSDDPLITPMGFQRDYDYVQFYSNIDDPEGFLQKKEDIPLSIANMSEEKKLDELTRRIVECNALASYETELQEHLKWLAVVTDQFGNVTVATVEPGGWYLNQSDDYSFKFYSEKEYIGYNDLQYTSLIIRVK